MKIDDFKHHKIQKANGIENAEPKKRSTRIQLSSDFNHRCCYCNTREETIMVPFHVDHFLPTAASKGINDKLYTLYDNLMWSCPKCNMSKGRKYRGDLDRLKKGIVHNDLFYNPVEIDYNQIFYRNEFGAIVSDDAKGKDMIQALKLYHPIHTLAWLIEKLEDTYSLLEAAIKKETNDEKKQIYMQAQQKISNIYIKKNMLFKAAYKDKFGRSE